MPRAYPCPRKCGSQKSKPAVAAVSAADVGRQLCVRPLAGRGAEIHRLRRGGRAAGRLIHARIGADGRVLRCAREQRLEVEQYRALLPPAVEEVGVLALLQLERALQVV